GAWQAIEIESQPEDFDLSSLGYHLVRPLSFRGRLQNTEDGVLVLEGQVAATYEGECARCLRPVRRSLELAVFERYRPAGKAAADDEPGYSYSGGHVDISQAVRDNLLPVLPSRLICRESCRGLCPYCGIDLNEQDCRCAADHHSELSPFGQIRNLRNLL
ncbi:MAG: DUF177 domain-containing protein, partial [Clostridiaceae bacterium]|nr:DUF177 domain-containing protein [Clostridiaceae bacterium]